MAPIGISSTGENITHYGAIRMRIVGEGSFEMSLFSYDDIYTTELVPFTLAATTNIEPTRLCNFVQQRAFLEFSTGDEIDEWFEISRIVIFVKEMYKSYPM